MKVTVRAITSNQEVVDRCRVTVWKESLGKDPSEKFMDDIYFSEHSPIRDKWFVVEVRGVPYWVSTHFVRHSIGYTPYVSTQREDRIMALRPRGEEPQGNLVNIDITLNAQASINVSRKRLCNMSSKETREVWLEIIKAFKEIDPELAKNCVKNCVYRGGICPEGKCSCKYNQTKAFKDELKNYIQGHENSYYKEV